MKTVTDALGGRLEVDRFKTAERSRSAAGGKRGVAQGGARGGRRGGGGGETWSGIAIVNDRQ